MIKIKQLGPELLKNTKKFDTLSFNDRMKDYLKWHTPLSNQNALCPQCTTEMKNNGDGFYRCRNGDCDARYIILVATE